MTALVTKVLVTCIGVLVLGAGVIMMVTPGPGLVGIVVGLAILATEWAWAERWLNAARRKLAEARDKAAQMDPKVRRRRLLWGGGAIIVIAVVVVWYLLAYDWPTVTVRAWDKAQGILGFLPDLPGM